MTFDLTTRVLSAERCGCCRRRRCSCCFPRRRCEGTRSHAPTHVCCASLVLSPHLTLFFRLPHTLFSKVRNVFSTPKKGAHCCCKCAPSRFITACFGFTCEAPPPPPNLPLPPKYPPGRKHQSPPRVGPEQGRPSIPPPRRTVRARSTSRRRPFCACVCGGGGEGCCCQVAVARGGEEEGCKV